MWQLHFMKGSKLRVCFTCVYAIQHTQHTWWRRLSFEYVGWACYNCECVFMLAADEFCDSCVKTWDSADHSWYCCS